MDWAQLSMRLSATGQSAQFKVFFLAEPDKVGRHPWQDMTWDTVKQSLVQCVKDLRAAIRAEIRAMQQTQLASNMEKK